MKTMNRAKFFLAVRMDPVLFAGNMQQSAVDNINKFIDEFERRSLPLLTWLAAMLATTLGEVGRAFNPVREGFKSSDAEAQAYVRRNFPHYSQVYNGLMYYGRGYVQLTWLANYQKFRTEILARFGVDIVAVPDAVLRPDIAIYILFEGMIRGVFTGKKLADYFTATATNWYFRPIINGMDKAAYHASMAQRFNAAGVAAMEDSPVVPKSVVKNVTSKERGAAKVGTGGAAVGTGVEATQQISPWIYVGVGAAILIAIVGIVLAVRKSRKLQAEWAKL